MGGAKRSQIKMASLDDFLVSAVLFIKISPRFSSSSFHSSLSFVPRRCKFFFLLFLLIFEFASHVRNEETAFQALQGTWRELFSFHQAYFLSVL